MVFDDDTAPATQPPMKYVAAGDLYSVAVSRTGEVFTWGHAAWGKLGHLDTDRFCVSFPRAVPQFHAEHPACMAAVNPLSSRVSTAPAETNSCTALRCPPIAACISGVEPPPPPRAFTSAPCVRRSRMDPS